MPNPPVPTPAQLERAYRRCALAPGQPDRIQLAERLALGRNQGVDWLNLAFEQFSGFDFPAGHAALDEAIARDSTLLAARWLRFQYPYHPAPVDEDEAGQFRRRWSEGLARFEALDLDQPALLQQAAVCIGATTSFYRHYLGDACLEEQRRYGRFCNEVMRRLIPRPPKLPKNRARPRVLFCTSFLYQHTVARLFLPLIEGLDPERLDIHLLHLGDRHDAMTERAARNGTLHRGPRSAQQWTALAYQLAADHIVHLDVGMDPTSQLLAAARLAPRQSMLWGHPVTTGLSTIDHALSPDDVEPAEGQSHYSECLVRMPGQGHGHAPDTRRDRADVADQATGSGELRLLCAQSAYKWLPEFDQVIARILASLPEATVHCTPHPTERVRHFLRDRVSRACAELGVDATTRIRWHGYQSLDGFLRLAASCHLNLDTPHWSGGMTSIDLVSLGLPTVTWEGRLMRSRQTAALLRRCGQSDLVAHDADRYVRLVRELASARTSLVDRRASLAEASAGIDDRQRVTEWMQRWFLSAG